MCTVSMCHADKCLFPYYGGCPYSRDCLYSNSDAVCGTCRPGWATNPASPGGECLCMLLNNATPGCINMNFMLNNVVAHFRFSLTSFSVVENAGPLIGSITLDTDGQIDRYIQVVVQTVVSGNAASKKL